MEATISIRRGCPPEVRAVIAGSTPATDPLAWITRQQAADALDVNPRTVDRYIRRGDLSAYAGPVPDRSPGQTGHGVRVWKDDVVNFHDNVAVEVIGE